MPGIQQEQIRRNEGSAECWQRYAGHRRVVSDLLLETPVTRSRPVLCVLGAGNCNDLDLPRLADRFAKLQLVDLDDQALRRGVSQQKLGEIAEVEVHGGVDLSGLIRLLDRWTAEAPVPADQVQGVLRQAEPPISDFPFGTGVPPALAGLAGNMDVVASVCLLSQLVETVVHCLGNTHPCFLDMIFFMRRTHLRLMLELLHDGSRGLLVTDFVSSDTCPQLVDVSPERLASLCAELIAQRNFFTGLNPMAIANCLRQDPAFQNRIGDVQVSSPWTWQYLARTYAVAAISFTKIERG
jgi:hypothetical protein